MDSLRTTLVETTQNVLRPRRQRRAPQLPPPPTERSENPFRSKSRDTLRALSDVAKGCGWRRTVSRRRSFGVLFTALISKTWWTGFCAPSFWASSW